MAHFFPNNAYDIYTAQSNLLKVIKDFIKHGGKMNENTSIQILGGGVQPGEDVMVTSRGLLSDAAKTMDFAKNYKFKENKASINQLPSQSSEIFVDVNSTQIMRAESITANAKEKKLSLLSRENNSMSLFFLSKVRTNFPLEYKRILFEYATATANSSLSMNGMDIRDMNEVNLELGIKKLIDVQGESLAENPNVEEPVADLRKPEERVGKDESPVEGSSVKKLKVKRMLPEIPKVKREVPDANVKKSTGRKLPKVPEARESKR